MYQAEVFTPFAEIRKNDDGSRTVYGLVTDEALDADSQIADLNWARKEMTDWSKYSNIRAMHKNEAVGVGKSMEDKGDGIWLESHIVDADAVVKIDAGVYKGYSIGIKSLPGNPYRVTKDVAARNGRIVGGAIVEVSIVDRPAHPDATFTVVKNVEALDKEASDLKILSEAAAMIRSVVVKDAVNETYEEALADVLSALGLTPDTASVDQPTEGKTVVVKPQEQEEVVDKAQVAEVIKGMTSEERLELGLVDPEQLDALKTQMSEQATLIAELGKTIKPTGVHTAGALSVQPVATELIELEQELEAMKSIHETAADTSMRQWAGLKINEITKAIEATKVAETV